MKGARTPVCVTYIENDGRQTINTINKGMIGSLGDKKKIEYNKGVGLLGGPVTIFNKVIRVDHCEEETCEQI